jgi:tetratricopeptide (TPR) repeat protein
VTDEDPGMHVHASATIAPAAVSARRKPSPALARPGLPAPASVGRSLEPRAQRILDLQRTAGNAAVVQRYFIGALEVQRDQGTDKPVAKEIFLRGAALYAAKDYAHAYDEFTRADELIPDPALTFNRAQALRKLGGRREEAIALYEEYLASGETKRAEEANSALAELRTPESVLA